MVPPPQMVANMKVGNMDAFCVGEPWNEQLVNQGIGFTACTTGEIWIEASGEGARHARRLGRQEPERRQGAADGRDGSPAMVRQDGEQGRRWRRSSASGNGSTCRSPTSSAALKGDINYGNGRVEKGTELYMKFWSEATRLLSLQEPRRLVRHREHPLGQVRAGHRHQGARRQGQPRGPLARGRQGARRGGVRHSGDRRRAARRRSSTARCSIPPTRRPT